MMIMIVMIVMKIMKTVRLRKEKIHKAKKKIKSEEDYIVRLRDLIRPYQLLSLSLVIEPNVFQYLLLINDTELTGLADHYMKLG